MDSTASNLKQGSQRVVRHTEYYIQSGDIIFRVRESIMSTVLTPDSNASTGGRYPISSTSLLFYPRVGILPQQTPPPASPRRIHKRHFRYPAFCSRGYTPHRF
jgi:hypothetical protein